MEHRWGERILMDVPVRLRCAGSRTTVAGQLCELSISGALVSMAVPLPRAARVDVDLAGGLVPAWIVRQDEGSIAVEWCELAPAPVVALENDARQFRRQWVA